MQQIHVTDIHGKMKLCKYGLRLQAVFIVLIIGFIKRTAEKSNKKMREEMLNGVANSKVS